MPSTDTDDTAPRLPADDHVHSQWSWDTTAGDMEATCAEAVRIGLPSVAFTEHVDHTVWTVGTGEQLPAAWTQHGIVDGLLTAPSFDAAGYLESIEKCRAAFPGLRIVTGVELGEPHRHRDAVAELLGTGGFTRTLASLHTAYLDEECVDVGQAFAQAPPEKVYAGYLVELEHLVTTYDGFQVLAHVDYPLRYWPAPTPLDLTVFEDRLRHLLGLLRDAGKALELNTQIPFPPTILRWWHEVGGEAISFASDAHRPAHVGRGLADAMALAEATGFRRAADPLAFWRRA